MRHLSTHWLKSEVRKKEHRSNTAHGVQRSLTFYNILSNAAVFPAHQWLVVWHGDNITHHMNKVTLYVKPG